jgi:hypothetical protein
VVDGHLCTAGSNDEFGQLSGVERYDVASNTWRLMANMLEGRRFFGAVNTGSACPAEEQDLFDSLIAKATKRTL